MSMILSMWPAKSARFGRCISLFHSFILSAAESQACADAAAEHVHSLEDQKAALMTEMEEAASASNARLEAEKKATLDAQAALQQQHASEVKELQAKISEGQVNEAFQALHGKMPCLQEQMKVISYGLL